MKRFFLVIIVLLLLKGCAYLPKELQSFSYDKNISLAQVFVSPEKYVNSTLLWGGRIINCINREKETFLEILQFPLDLDGRPKEEGISQGRFRVESSKFLDCALYSPGRLITVGGVLKGFEEGKIGERTYKFPLIEEKVIYLWREEARVQVECFYPWWSPWSRCFPYSWYYLWCLP